MLSKIAIPTLFVLFSITSPVTADPRSDDYSYVLDIIQSLKIIVQKDKNESESRAILDSLKGAKPLMKNNQYQGHQIIRGMKLYGLIGIDRRNARAIVAVYSTPPLWSRKATRRYTGYRNQLLSHYKELEHNQFDLGDQVIAHLKKQTRKVTIDVYRKK